MSFHDDLFPEAISYGSKGGPQFNTTVLTLSSGYEKRNINWSQVQAVYDVAHGIKDRPQMEELQAFFMARQGKAYSFRFKDWMDFTIEGQQIGTGDGVRTAFQITKRYESGGYFYDRLITKPVSGSLIELFVGGVGVTEGVDFTINYNTGVVTFSTPPTLGDSITIGYIEFHVHVRFDTDHFDVQHDFWETMSWSSIPLVEIKESAT